MNCHILFLLLCNCGNRIQLISHKSKPYRLLTNNVYGFLFFLTADSKTDFYFIVLCVKRIITAAEHKIYFLATVSYKLPSYTRKLFSLKCK